VHQVNRTVFRKSGLPQPSARVLRDLQGHPVLNQRVGERLDALREFIDRPEILRTKVAELIEELRREALASVSRGRTVQF
jgi:hypothetical protein